MVIRVSSKVTSNPIPGYIALLEAQDQIIDELLDETVDEVGPLALADLRKEPGPVKYPIQWTSDKQRRAFFATNGFGGGIPYRRKGKLANAWVMEVRGKSIVIENPASAARYVYGSLAQNRSAAMRFKQQFHTNTGWQTATDTARIWLDKADEVFREKYDRTIAEFADTAVTRRAYTR